VSVEGTSARAWVGVSAPVAHQLAVLTTDVSDGVGW
jgi:hypothetical protein